MEMRLISGMELTSTRRSNQTGWMRMATDAELRLGAPIELELALMNSPNEPRSPAGCTIARGRVIEVRANRDSGEPAYIAKVSIDAVERREEAA